jgi:D-beta-D-heptose 7-phosphate kinase/D-beta-D-heptose 1-phosphate adenosyltransferase
MVDTVGKLKTQGKKIVFTNGCFDLLHVGHLHSFREAKRHGDVLIVGLNSDESVRTLKGKGRPFVPEAQRAEMLAALRDVDYVVIFPELDPLSIITDLLPDVLAKGEDWAEGAVIGQDVVEAHGGKVMRVSLVPGTSTTNILQKITASAGRSETA